ncbi:N-terminal EF-hand calcium-binding protein 1 [Pteropus alecto]|uniref:N-terminal EF-hand calcium-binding protein 1 n=1 Tax=Pteropus alecto TaxID=9402 RepID=L5JT19_PTEAL|nr:N-terminal EF-hand calcium-binding protein 1 [Pteropus alecto]
MLQARRVLKCEDYQEASSLEQFVTRFLLKETLSQLQSLQNSLECAMETTEEQTRQERQVQCARVASFMALRVAEQRGPSTPEVLSTQRPGRRSGRRVQRFGGFSPGGPQLVASSPGFLEEDSRWATQIDRLQRLIDRLEKKHILLVQRQMAVVEEDARDFQLALKHYADGAAAQSGCLRISIQKLSNESRYMIYEFWENSNLWNSFMVDPEQQLDVPRASPVLTRM